ncbi:hypothetical protein ACN42_g7910 [Penicillium freii]|uniref:Protein kinase domain-containing protein n=1 Tax=Penicillium freii TaxID=48697 RepID=A0A101MF46_PENFR|nr:hypothetical protein ACN42_g7910 [Penicillium freii]
MWWVKLSDFGLSKRVEEASGALTLKGTAGYIAPELYKFTERGTAYAPDIWAVGAILFFMLLKRPVFGALGHLFEYAKNEDFPTQPLADVGTTDLSIEFISSLMRASPNDRPSAKMAILHECVRPIYDHLSSWRMPDSTQPSPPSPIEPLTEEFKSKFGSLDTKPLLTLGDPPIEPMAEEFESEFGSLDTKPLLTLGDPLHQEPNDQPSALPTESLDVAVHRQMISACGGVVRPMNKFIHRGFAGKISFSADSRVLAMAGNKEIIRLWNTSSYSQLPGLRGKLCIAFSPDGKLIASCGMFAYMQLWDAVTLAEVGHTNLSDYPHTVVFSPDSRMIAYAINHKVVVQEVSGGSKRRRVANCNVDFRDKDSPSYLSFSPDSKSVWFACLDKYQMLDIEQDLAGRTFKLPVVSKTIDLSPDGKYLAYLDNAKKAHVCLLELSTRDVVLKIETGIQNPTGLAFSPNSKLLAVSLSQSFSRGNLSLWDIETAKKLSEIVPNDRIRSMAFSPDGTMLASTNSNGSTTLWGADTRDQHED